MQRRRVWRSVWQPCWQWPLWCRQQMQRCQRFRTSNRLTSIWEHASLWSLPVYWVNKQLSIPLKTDSKPPTIHWAKIQPVAKRFSPYISLSLSLTPKHTHSHSQAADPYGFRIYYFLYPYSFRYYWPSWTEPAYSFSLLKPHFCQLSVPRLALSKSILQIHQKKKNNKKRKHTSFLGKTICVSGNCVLII